MSTIEAIILAVIEGLTEFLPVSSTGHMIIGSSLMGISSDPFVKAFTVAIQLGAIASVVALYSSRFWQSLRFYFILGVGFLPALVAGLLFNDRIDTLLERVDVVGWALIAGGLVLLTIDRVLQPPSTAAHPKYHSRGRSRSASFSASRLFQEYLAQRPP